MIRLVRIKSDSQSITCDGHAVDMIRCAMLTAITVSTLENLDRIGDAHDYALSPGRFVLSRRGLSDAGNVIADSLAFSLRSLARDYPDHFVMSET